MMDEKTGYLWSTFLSSKNETEEKGFSIIQKIFGAGKRVQGKIKKMIQKCLTHFPHIKVEYTAPGTPEQIGKVERKFSTMYSKVRAILTDAGLPQNLKQKLWQSVQIMSPIQKIFWCMKVTIIVLIFNFIGIFPPTPAI